MRNLKISFAQAISVPEDIGPCVTAWDATDDSIVCAFGPTDSSPTISLKRGCVKDAALGESLEPIASWDAPCPSPELPSDKVVCLQHFSDIATTCLVLAGGDLVVVREHPQHGEEKIEIVGSVDAGIAAAAWAPDEELLAVVTEADTLLLMTRSFEPVIDVTLKPEHLKISKHVSVGWGKRETQFQGKRAKALRDPTMPESIDSGKLSPYDDGSTTISWRGDGAFLAINRIVPDSRRVIRIFTREGTIDGASEPVDGLESALSWRPAGNLIAGVQRLAEQACVVFFERNGLRHGEFSLRLSEGDTNTWASGIALDWNTDSTTLAVSFRDRVQLWTMSNCHYYLKREMLIDNGAPAISQIISWHPENPLRLAVVKIGTMFIIEYVFGVDRGSTVQPNDNGVVAVVDGKSLSLTPLRHAMVPPPMSFLEITTSENIVDCAVNPQGNRVATISGIGIEMFKWDPRSKPAQTPEKVASLALAADAKSLSMAPFCQILMQKDDSIWCVSPSVRGRTRISIYAIEASSAVLVETKSSIHELSNQASLFRKVFTDKHHEHLWLEGQTGLCGLDPFDPSFSSPIYSSTEIVRAERKHLNGDKNESFDNFDRLPWDYQMFSLSPKGELFANGRLLTRGCTSFVTTQLHLIFTTSQNLLKFVHLDAADEYEIPADTAVADERCRSIERGARVITVIPSIYAVVLQMPRGNLETIYPRALVLAGIRYHLDNRDLKSAFLACRNHQVDVNILYDHRPEFFMQHVPQFIEQVKKTSRIDLFLSKLSEDDVSKTLYRNTLAKSEVHVIGGRQLKHDLDGVANDVGINTAGGGKVNRICDAFLSVLKPRLSRHLQNIVTAYVCKRPPDLVSALELIASLRKTDVMKAEQAVSHLCFLSDVNRLYDTALSLYDLPLALLVAQQAQRDPREYMPFLQSLNESSHFRRRFQIDDHLRKHDKALISLHDLASHKEAEAYTIKHSLYRQALRIYRHEAEHLASTTRLYASHLSSKSNHLASAIASESLPDYLAASTSYAKCSPPRWREALHCACMVQPPLPDQQLRSLALQLATSLTDVERDHRSASQIHIDYLSNPATAARLLCKGSYFSESLRLLSLHHLSDQIPDTVDTALAEKSGEMTELIADCRAQLSAQVPRIKELRIKKAEDPLAFFGGDPTTSSTTGADNDIPDNISLAPTDASTLGGQSLFTRYGNHRSNQSTHFGGGSVSSRKTSKTRRKEERKRARGKKGSVYEEEYLVNSVRRLVERVNAVHGEVQRLMEGLARRSAATGGGGGSGSGGDGGSGGNIERREAVEDAFGAVVSECETAVLEIWGVDGDHGDRDRDGGGDGDGDKDGRIAGDDAPIPASRPSGADGVLWQSQMATTASRLKETPKVKTWKGDGLFGS